MARPKGEQMTVVRLPTRLVDAARPEADRRKVGVGVVIAEQLDGRHAVLAPPRADPPPGKAAPPKPANVAARRPAAADDRCSCEKPDPTPYGVCRVCGLRR